MIHQGSAGFQGTPTDIEIHAKEVLSLRKRMAEIIAFHSGKPYDQVEKDIDRDRFMTSEEAKAYGIIDEVIESRTTAEKQGGALLQGEPARLMNDQAEPSLAEQTEA
jgi:ATP-dependent Clp protease protease subunit